MKLMTTPHPLSGLLALLFLTSGLSAQSVVDETKKRERSSFQSQEFQRSLTSKKPSRESLEAFETRVEQKLRDLTDYMGIASDTSYKEQLRDRAKKQALELFDSSSTRIIGLPLGPYRRSDGSVEGMLDSLRREGSRTSIEVEGFRSEDFQAADEGGYKGNFEFEMLMEFEGSGNEGKIELKGKGVSILKKVPKRFGEEKKRVWETFLGKLEFSQ